MKIKKIKINNYGNLENKEINLENKINIIYGKNESGKSTLLNYIKNIFYGISKNKNGKDISDYEKYKPWLKEEFSGKLSYELDDGEKFEVVRDFNKRNPKLYNSNFEEISGNYNIDKKDGVQFFYEQTNVDEIMFLSTIVSMQQEVKLDKQAQQVLVQKIANLAGTGDSEVSFKKVLDQLNKKQVDEIGTDRTQGKPINVIRNRMEEIEFVIKGMSEWNKKKELLEEEKGNLQKQILELETKNDILKDLHKVQKVNDFDKQKIQFNEERKKEIQEKINTINEEKNKLLENKKIIEEKKEYFLENKNTNSSENNFEKNNLKIKNNYSKKNNKK